MSREAAHSFARVVRVKGEGAVGLKMMSNPYEKPSRSEAALAFARLQNGTEESLRQAVAAGLSLREIEERYTDMVLEQTGGNKLRAAKILGIDRKTLYRRAERRRAEAQ